MTRMTQALDQIVQNQQQGGNPRELNLVKIQPYYGRDDEDPTEWLEAFDQAATANQ
jgi:hypothetical protein